MRYKDVQTGQRVIVESRQKTGTVDDKTQPRSRLNESPGSGYIGVAYDDGGRGWHHPWEIAPLD